MIIQIVKKYMWNYAIHPSHFIYLCQENGLPAILKAEDRLRQALEPAHIQLLAQISKLPGGVKDIVDMRNDLLVREDFWFTGEGQSTLISLKFTEQYTKC